MSSGGIGYIPYSEISDWLNEERIFEYDERHEYRCFINFIDREYVKNTTENINRKIEKKKKKHA